MIPRRIHPLILCVFVAVTSALAGQAEEQRGQPIEFVQAEYARAISEYHDINKAVMHVRATGCSGPVKYAIVEVDTSFNIDSKGHVILVKALNYDTANIHHITVKASSGDGKCVAFAKVRFDVLNRNKHKPEFEKREYGCFVSEDSRKVQLLPKIRVLDKDHGSAGKVTKVSIIEDGLPFKTSVDDEGIVTMVATKDLDAETVSGYYFDLVAQDGGDPPKKSSPLSINCAVIDVNEASPKFDKDTYSAIIYRGHAYDSILKVEANDDDMGPEYGQVCKYNIQTKDTPFSVDDKGIISLKKPLPPGSPDHFTFQVAAVDCGGKMSTKNAVIKITVEIKCSKGFLAATDEEFSLQQCMGKVRVAPGAHLNDCVKKAGQSNFSAMVHLKTPAGRGCDRETFDTSGLYAICGAGNFVDLLPRPGIGREWTKDLKVEEGDNTAFKFDGSTAVELPPRIFPSDLGTQFTISLWVKMTANKEKQVIFASGDKTRLDRVHLALVTRGTQLIFLHRREPLHASRDLYCKSLFHYKPNIFDKEWHHIALVVDGCNTKLYVDGEHITPEVVDSNWTLHKSTIPTLMVVGAHWLAKEKTYTQYFTGSLSGLAIRPQKTTMRQVLACLVGCREHINVDGPLPKGFKSEVVDFGTLKITGFGEPQQFETILQNVVYVNERLTPTPGFRKVQILPTAGKSTLPMISADINVEKNTKPTISIRGCKDIAVTKKKLKEVGVQLCQSLVIDYRGCENLPDTPVNKVRYLDTAVVKINPPFNAKESLGFQKGSSGETILQDSGFSVNTSPTQMVIRGVAHYSAYVEVLRELTYINLDPDGKAHHDFTISVATLNGMCKSDRENLVLRILQEEFLRGLDLHAADASLRAEQLPGAVLEEAPVATASHGAISASIMAIIVICSLIMLVVLVVFGIYKHKRSPAKVAVPTPEKEREELYWDDTGLGGVRVTINPMQKFQELDLNEDGHGSDGGVETEDDELIKHTKGQLEWDDADM